MYKEIQVQQNFSQVQIVSTHSDTTMEEVKWNNLLELVFQYLTNSKPHIVVFSLETGKYNDNFLIYSLETHQLKYGKQSFNQIKLKEMILWYNGQEDCTRGVISTKEKISWGSGQRFFSNIEKKT